MITSLTTFILNIFDNYQKRKITYVLKNIFNDNKIKTVLDVGAHKGETINYLSKFFYFNKVYSFEPNPSSFFFLKKYKLSLNIRKQSKLELFNYALGVKKGKIDFYSGKESSSSTIHDINFTSNYYKKKNKYLNPFAQNKETFRKISVNLDTLQNFIISKNIQDIDLLKIDTEGSEFNIIKGAKEKIKIIKVLYFEHHYDNMILKKYTFSDLNRYLMKKGFSKVFKYKMSFRKVFEYVYVNKALI
jgi:FkbM family methyltransferase